MSPDLLQHILGAAPPGGTIEIVSIRILVHGEDDAVVGPVEELVVATGFRPDLSITRELRLKLDEVSESPVALAPLIDPNVHSCGTVYPHGAAELAHPEPDFYVVGMKSYGPGADLPDAHRIRAGALGRLQAGRRRRRRGGRPARASRDRRVLDRPGRLLLLQRLDGCGRSGAGRQLLRDRLRLLVGPEGAVDRVGRSGRRMLRMKPAAASEEAAVVPSRSRLYYGWVLVGVLGVTATVSYGILSYAFAVFIAPMQAELGWSKAAITGRGRGAANPSRDDGRLVDRPDRHARRGRRVRGTRATAREDPDGIAGGPVGTRRRAHGNTGTLGRGARRGDGDRSADHLLSTLAYQAVSSAP
jgi:hypothetical protein